jgi:hypothetical protein
MNTLLVLSGAGFFLLSLAMLALPCVLDYRNELARVSPLIRQVFCTYSVYIWATNLCFGLLSAFAPGWLLDGSPLARAVCGYIAVYWGARIVLQFAYYDRSVPAVSLFRRVAEVLLVTGFACWTALYGTIAVTGGRSPF